MRFMFKIAASMVCLIALLAGTIASTFAFVSFEDALQRERENAIRVYEMLMNSFLTYNTESNSAPSDQVFLVLDGLSKNQVSLEAIRLTSDAVVIYETGTVA